MFKDLDFERFVTLVIAFVVIIALGFVSSCEIHKDYQIAASIKSGADPISVRIALSDNTTSSELMGALIPNILKIQPSSPAERE